MDAKGAIAALDNALARNGEDVTLMRPTGTTGTGPSVTCRARVTAYRPEQLVGSLVQGDSQVIISPSQIDAARWPTSDSKWKDTTTGDQRVPRHGDVFIIQGRTRRVKSAAPFYIDGTLVRIEATVIG